MKKLIIAATLALTSSAAFAGMSTVWVNGEPIMINQIGNSTFISGPSGMTSCTTIGSMTTCN